VFNKTTKRGLTDIKGGRNQPPNSKLGEREGESEDDRGITGWGDTFGGGNRRRRRRGSRIEVERSLNWTGLEKRRRPAADRTSVKRDGNLSEMIHRSRWPLHNNLVLLCLLSATCNSASTHPSHTCLRAASQNRHEPPLHPFQVLLCSAVGATRRRISGAVRGVGLRRFGAVRRRHRNLARGRGVVGRS
jgi:hypothetical protein